jgi:hypothetical protein
VRDPQRLYELIEDLPDLGRPVLIQALTGFIDAGSATQLAREHLLSSLEAQQIATFDVDELLDYRSRRPAMIFVEDHWQHYDEPRLALHMVRDDAGTPFLLLEGAEPDLRWNRFISDLTALIGQLNVRLTVGLNAIPMAVPHTRPIGLTPHATRPELIAGYEPWLNRVQVPASVSNLLEYRRGQRGEDAIGFAVHVPHYLAQTEYPAASATLLTAVSRATGLLLPTGPLHRAAEVFDADIESQIAQADEVRALVNALEEQYDALLRGRQAPSALPSETGPLPTADELGAELERFLAEHTKPGEPPGG